MFSFDRSHKLTAAFAQLLNEWIGFIGWIGVINWMTHWWMGVIDWIGHWLNGVTGEWAIGWMSYWWMGVIGWMSYWWMGPLVDGTLCFQIFCTVLVNLFVLALAYWNTESHVSGDSRWNTTSRWTTCRRFVLFQEKFDHQLNLLQNGNNALQQKVNDLENQMHSMKTTGKGYRNAFSFEALQFHLFWLEDSAWTKERFTCKTLKSRKWTSISA